MKLGTQIRFNDGREATVVYNSLIGVGIKWGLHNPDPKDFENTTGNTIDEEVPKDWIWEPEAILRSPWDGCGKHGFSPEQCVDIGYDIIRHGTAKTDIEEMNQNET